MKLSIELAKKTLLSIKTAFEWILCTTDTFDSYLETIRSLKTKRKDSMCNTKTTFSNLYSL
jgi:hypothetical protein